MRSSLYFAYGSNMNRARLEARVGRCVDHGLRVVRGFRHAFAKRGADGTAKGTIVEAADSAVHGVLYELTPDQLARLRAYEGGYHAIEVRVDAPATAALTFRALRLVGGLAPAPWYLEHYVIGMREHAFPDDYVVRILEQAGAG